MHDSYTAAGGGGLILNMLFGEVAPGGVGTGLYGMLVLAILAVRPAYGYEITARLREEGFSDLAEGTVYVLLVRIEQRGFVDVEKVPSEKGLPRKVYSINAQGQGQLDEFWRTWSFLAERIDQLHHTIGHHEEEAGK